MDTRPALPADDYSAAARSSVSPAAPTLPGLVTEADFGASVLGKDTRAAQRLRYAGKGPRAICIAGSWYYRPAAIEDWLLSLEQPSAAPPAYEHAPPASRRKLAPRTTTRAKLCAIPSCSEPVAPRAPGKPGPSPRYCTAHLPLRARRAALRAAKP